MAAPQATLLVVDDEELNRDGLARRLQRHDYEVVTAPSGREAIELLGGRRFDLVLLDIMMPGMNGLEVLKFLRRVDSLLDLPIIMVTAKGESEDMVEAGRCRSLVNKDINRVRAMFRWAVEHELLPVTIYQALLAVGAEVVLAMHDLAAVLLEARHRARLP